MKSRRVHAKIAICATLVLAASVMVSCQGGKKDSQPAAAQGKLAPVTLKMIVPGTPQKDQALVNDAVSKYLKDTLNITLDLEQIDWASWNDKNNLIIASGENCDLIFTAPWCGYITNAAKGAFFDLGELLNTYGADIKKQDYNWIIDAGKTDGKLYAVPSYQMLAQSRGFILRKDIVDKYGFKVADVNRPEDLEAMLKVVKEKEPDLIPLYGNPSKLLSFMGPWERQGQFEVTTVDVYSGKAQYVNFYDTDYYRDSMALARRWFQAGYVNKDIATTKEDLINVMKAGKAFAIMGQTNIPELASFEKRAGLKLVMFPVIKPVLSTGLVQGAMFAIPRQSKNPERAMMLLNRLHTDKVLQNMLVYGIEGTHYVKESENHIQPAPGVDPANPSYFNLVWMFGNQAILYTYGDEDKNAPAILDKFNKDAVRSPALGFTYNPDKMKNEIAALANVAAEFDPIISSGAVDPRSDGLYDKFLAKLKAAGIDKLLADQQGQLDAWVKSK